MTHSVPHRLATFVAAFSIWMAAGAARAQDQTAVPEDALITMERTACFGECPVYRVSIDSRGRVEFTGQRFVRVTGQQTARIPQERVGAILRTARRINFFALRDRYTDTVTDMPTTFVTIRSGGRSKRVEDYFGAPAGLKELEEQIDVEARTRRWIALDTEMLEDLARSGWHPSNEELAEQLTAALRSDDVAVVKGLLSQGADPNAEARLPLMNARSAEAMQALIDAGANPQYRANFGTTPLHRAVALSGDAVAVILKAGVPVDYPDEDGKTGLWYAACAGNAGAVAVLLKAGAKPDVAFSGKSAVACAREADEFSRAAPRLQRAGREPFARDFVGVIALLEQALAQRRK